MALPIQIGIILLKIVYLSVLNYRNMFKKLLFCFVFLMVFNFVSGQNNYGIIFPLENEKSKCNQFDQVFSQKPKEVHFAIRRVKNAIFFEVNDKKWFSELFKNKEDGIAIDVVAKDRYACGVEELQSKQIKGKLLKPIFSQKLKGGLRPSRKDVFRVLVGRIPPEMTAKELEFNILFLSNKVLCKYYLIYDLESYPWDLLDMGMYLDTITYNTKKIAVVSEDKFKYQYKEMKFNIPFEKNKSEYSHDDIKPLYDSLRLTDFNIKTINIHAYASVEGSLKRNLELQEQRANSIAKAMQSFQKPTISTKITSSENWVEFLNDISTTAHKHLKEFSKSEIKAKLIGDFSKELEPVLKQHRKAVIVLELERKDIYKAMTPLDLLDLFSESIKTSKLDDAIAIQNAIYERLKKREVSPDILDKMVIPKQMKFLPLLNKNAVYRSLLDERNLLITQNQLQQLEELSPKDKKIKYNLAVVNIKIWRYRAKDFKATTIKKQIVSLKSYGIDAKLIERMLVNYHIVMSENYMKERNYASKDKSVDFINKTYGNFPKSDYDYLSLAQFFSYYSNTDAAVALLNDKAKTIAIDENLLFYYINLTIINNELTATDDYRTIMLNAFSMNKKRYCKLYNPFGEGGVTFQLLEDEYLRSYYCENCIKE